MTETAKDKTVTTYTLDFAYDAQGAPYSITVTLSGIAQTYYYITNLQGDVMYLLDAAGNTVAAYDYDPYGKIIGTNDYSLQTLGRQPTEPEDTTKTIAELNPLRYRGYYYDTDDLGFYYLQSRYYDADTCRFISEDEYTDTDTGYLGYNMFAYCNNNPILASDPNGKWLHIAIGAIVGAVAGVVGQAISDVVTSVATGEVKVSNWQTYAGAAIGGAAGGVVLATTSNMDAANAVTGAVTTGVGQSLEKLTIKDYDKSWLEIGANTLADGAVSFGLGKLPGIKKVTAGRNSYSAVYKSGLTKLRHHTAKRMSMKVFSKGIKSSIVGGLALDGYYGVKQATYDKLKALLS